MKLRAFYLLAAAVVGLSACKKDPYPGAADAVTAYPLLVGHWKSEVSWESTGQGTQQAAFSYNLIVRDDNSAKYYRDFATSDPDPSGTHIEDIRSWNYLLILGEDEELNIGQWPELALANMDTLDTVQLTVENMGIINVVYDATMIIEDLTYYRFVESFQ